MSAPLLPSLQDPFCMPPSLFVQTEQTYSLIIYDGYWLCILPCVFIWSAWLLSWKLYRVFWKETVNHRLTGRRVGSLVEIDSFWWFKVRSVIFKCLDVALGCLACTVPACSCSVPQVVAQTKYVVKIHKCMLLSYLTQLTNQMWKKWSLKSCINCSFQCLVQVIILNKQLVLALENEKHDLTEGWEQVRTVPTLTPLSFILSKWLFLLLLQRSLTWWQHRDVFCICGLLDSILDLIN